MKKIIWLIFLLLFCFFTEVLTDEVSCEKNENCIWSVGDWKTCYMDKTAQINSANTTIVSQDESIRGLWFNYNRKIRFLPIKISDKFPNLIGLTADSCSLTVIFNANFKGLSKMRILYLNGNRIEKIASDVFNDLTALEKLYLYNNNLKFINGKAFARLTKLNFVDLSPNQCISEVFVEASRIAVLQQTVDEKCSFDESEDSSVETSTIATGRDTSLVDKKCDQNQDLATFANITVERIEAKTLEVISKLNELKIQQKEECGTIISKILEAQVKTLTAEIIEVKVKSEIQIMLKMREIERLREELQRKNEEIIKKNEKIKKLEEMENFYDSQNPPQNPCENLMVLSKDKMGK